jgi:hypothetical protein
MKQQIHYTEPEILMTNYESVCWGLKSFRVRYGQ